MKKLANIFMVLFVIFLLSSCFTSQDDVNKAKQNLGIIDKIEDNIISVEKTENEINDEYEIKQDTIEEIEEIIVKEEIQKIQIQSLTENQLLEFNDLSKKDLLSKRVEITGKTLGKVDKIIVTFKNETSDFPDDRFQLKKFASGDDNFLYRAFTEYETLDLGKNIYVFEAYIGEKVTKLELILNVFEEENVILEEKKVVLEKNKIYEKIDISKLPVNEKFGNPINLGNNKIGYSDLNGLEIKKDINPTLTCETLTNILKEKATGWFYWNTCREIKKDEGISFYVIRLDEDKYIYEKHYYLSYEGIYGIQELETGEGVSSETIKDKNTELKEKNKDFSILEISDKLFSEILK